jgi:hypothetical protein
VITKLTGVSPAGALKVKVRVPVGAAAEMVTKRLSVVVEAFPVNDAVTPVPLKEAPVTLAKFVPVTMTVNDVPTAPAEGNIELIEGGTKDWASRVTEPNPIKANNDVTRRQYLKVQSRMMPKSFSARFVTTAG